MKRLVIAVILLIGGLFGLSMTLCGATFFGIAVYEFFQSGRESMDTMIMGWLMGLFPGAAILLGTWRIVVALRSPAASTAAPPEDTAPRTEKKIEEPDSNPWR